MRVRSFVTVRRIERIRAAVERVIATGDPVPIDPATLGVIASAHVDTRRHAAIGAIATASSQSKPEPWHRVRLCLKRWRYAIECARPLLDAESGEASGEAARDATLVALRAAQKALGRVEDLEVLRGMLQRQVTRAAMRGRAAEATALARFDETLAGEQLTAIEEAYRLGTILSAGAALDG